MSYLTRQAALLYKDNDRATEISHTEGVADKPNSNKAALFIPFFTLKE